MPTEHTAQMASHSAATADRRALMHDAPSVTAGDWYAPGFSIQTWLERTPWRTLRGTHFGMGGEEPHPVFWDDPLIREIYKIDVATFLTAEQISVEGISKLVSMAPDEASRLFLATQTIDEARHYEVFCRRMADVGVTPAERQAMVSRVTTRELQTFYDLIREQVDRGDLVSAMVAHNIVLEGMAYPIYRYEIKYWSKLDPGLSRMIQGAFADEVHHVGFGEAFVADAVRLSPAVRARVTKLCREASGLMNNVFDSVVRKYIGLYQTVADRHCDLMGDIQIFPGKLMADITEEEQVRTLNTEIQRELSRRLAAININID
ncbi:long-chain fatty aldehyde decarbonylase [Hydrogenophaga sp.]|uniref:long-chain fatty aldehyde decarbonylase n=2 Tax=Hydrogenophaga sp. TaxID=1904254 RepID=UPI00262A44FF|nr:long-chain fatty aldehyde decarbonylase [Hydrogenophaga sp.]